MEQTHKQTHFYTHTKKCEMMFFLSFFYIFNKPDLHTEFNLEKNKICESYKKKAKRERERNDHFNLYFSVPNETVKLLLMKINIQHVLLEHDFSASKRASERESKEQQQNS